MVDNEDWTDKELEEMRSRNIDFSDIPELTPQFLQTLKRVVPREHYKVVPVKKAISIKLDADVLEYYKSKGKGYQTRINRILRAEMLKETAPVYGGEQEEENEHDS
ncbi:MAG: cytoplasmic protein [Spirochaetia bacterium]|nr:cytoplasmic protein [Spirochaetia bacterium]